MKYTIEFELPDNDTILRNIKTDYVYWGVWGYSGCCHAQPVVDAIPTEWIREQMCEYPGMESAMWSKLLRLWKREADNE